MMVKFEVQLKSNYQRDWDDKPSKFFSTEEEALRWLHKEGYEKLGPNFYDPNKDRFAKLKKIYVTDSKQVGV